MRVTISVAGMWHAFQLAEQLEKRGHLHRIITSFPKWKIKAGGTRGGKVEDSHITTILTPEVLWQTFKRVPGLNRKLNEAFYWKLHLFDQMAARKIDNCDILTVFAKSALYSMRAAKNRGAITVLESGSSHVLYYSSILSEEYERYGIRNSPIDPRIIHKELREYRECDYIMIPSEFVRGTFIENGVDPGKILKVPYGVNLGDFKKLPKEDDVFRVIFTGGLSLRKGVHYLLEAFNGLRLNKAELILVGSIVDDPIRKFINKSNNRCKFIGSVPHKELHKFYSNSSIFVLPSIEEGLAGVIPEAMACGLPVIVTENTGGRDIVRDGVDGFVIPIRDSETLMEKILFFYENEEARREMGENAKERVKEFTWDRYGEKIVSIYKEIFERGPNP